MISTLRTFISCESGAVAIEYGLIAALVCIGMLGALTAFGGQVANIYEFLAAVLDSVSPL
ncbi:MAG TPA: Flp family type IVb pilin [Dongiaceae bacterium]|jgi:pilus assembly protein Flp/PilA